MLYVYAIADAPRPAVDGQRGIDSRPLEVQSHGSISAVFSQHDDPSSRLPVDENVWRHEQVVEALMRDHAVLPARFSTTFADESKLDAALAAHHDRLVEGLGRVRGRIELGVSVLWGWTTPPPQAHPPRPATGAAYMAARLAEEQRRRDEQRRAEALADHFHAPLAALAVDTTRRVLLAPQLPLTAAYLVPRGGAEEFRRRVNELAAAHPAVRVLCTGPWPPYHFVPTIADVPGPRHA